MSTELPTPRRRDWLTPAIVAVGAHGLLAALPVDLVNPPLRPAAKVVKLRLPPPPKPKAPAPPPKAEPPPPPKPKPKPKAVPKPKPKPKPKEEPPPPPPETPREPVQTPEPPAPKPPPPPPPKLEPQPKPEPPPTKVDLNAYRNGMHRSVLERRRYPRAAKRLGLQGRAVVAVRIDRQGQLKGEPRILRSAGHEILDEEALRMVRASAPFPPLPPGFRKKWAEFAIPIRFKLRR